MIMSRVTVVFCIFLIINLNPLVTGDITFDELVDEVTEFINNTSTYVYPTNNNEFFGSQDPNSTIEPVDFGTFDFIIVGSGSGGGVVANRLTEIEEFSVLLIEAGQTDPTISWIVGLATTCIKSAWNWGYNTTIQTNSCLGSTNQQCSYPRGKALGGTSTIDEGLYVRLNPKDLDRWVDLGNTNWTYEDVLPYFKKSENCTTSLDIDPTLHGYEGVQKTGQPEDTPTLTEALLDAFIEIGKIEGDYCHANQTIVGRSQFYLDRNIHTNIAHSFLHPVSNRSNLIITLESLATKIVIENDTATGVEFWKNGTKYLASVKKEVIVSGGVINSPQLLMLSGIGPQEELDLLDIPVIADLPVGKNLLDHVAYQGLFFRTNGTYYDNTVEENLALWWNNHRPYTAGFGVQTVTYFSVNKSSDGTPDIEAVVAGPPNASPSTGKALGLSGGYAEALEVLNSTTDFAINVLLMQPHSAGQVTLQSADPRDFPLIDTNYFEDSSDVDTMYKGIQAILALLDTEGFQRLGISQIVLDQPDCDDEYEKLSEDWWKCSLRYIAFPGFHGVGTAAMGANSTTSVVNQYLKVHGLSNIRVVDASVMPTQITGNPLSAITMIGERAADFIKADHLQNKFPCGQKHPTKGQPGQSKVNKRV